MKKLLMILMIGMFFISLTSAYDLGTVKQNTCIDLYQWCDDCTYVNVTSVQLANKTITYHNVAMVKNGYDYTYNYCNNSLLGDYFYTVCGDTSATNKCETFSYGVTLNGNPPADGITTIFFIVVFIAIFLFGLIYFFVSLERVVHLDMDLMDTLIMVLSYLSMWLFYYFAQEYLGNAIINNFLEIAIDVGAVTHVFLPLVGFFVSFIMTNLKFKQKARITY